MRRAGQGEGEGGNAGGGTQTRGGGGVPKVRRNFLFNLHRPHGPRLGGFTNDKLDN
jgi:hypothetical protein